MKMHCHVTKLSEKATMFKEKMYYNYLRKDLNEVLLMTDFNAVCDATADLQKYYTDKVHEIYREGHISYGEYLYIVFEFTSIIMQTNIQKMEVML